MKHSLIKFGFAALVAACAFSLTEQGAKAHDYYYYGGPAYYAGAYYAPAPAYYYPPVYAAPVVSYGFVAGPPVVTFGAVAPAYYYPESFGWYAPYYPAEVKYSHHHGVVKVEIDD